MIVAATVYPGGLGEVIQHRVGGSGNDVKIWRELDDKTVLCVRDRLGHEKRYYNMPFVIEEKPNASATD